MNYNDTIEKSLMSTYILVDTANTFFRARHIVKDNNPETKVGLAMHIFLNLSLIHI